MDKTAFYYTFEKLLSNTGLFRIFSDEHLRVAEVYYERYLDLVSNLDNNTGALASLITVRNYALTSTVDKKKEFKNYFALHIKKKKFVKSKDQNGELISILIELIEEEIISSDVITVEQFLEKERNLKLKVPKSYKFLYELIEAFLIGSSFYRMMDTNLIQDFNKIAGMDLFYFAKRYNRFIYYKLHAAVIEHILDYHFESKEQRLPSVSFKRRLIDIDKDIKKVEQPSPGRNETDETSQESVCRAVKKVLENPKLSKRYFREKGKRKGTYNLDGISRHLLNTDFREVENPIGVRMLREKVRNCLPKDQVPQKAK